MKKILFILICLLLLAFVACDSSSSTQSSSYTPYEPIINSGSNSNNNNTHTHDWIPATCEQLKTCKTCGIETGMLSDHIWKEATCVTLKTCTVCEKTEGEYSEHTYEEAITVEATCTQEGRLTKTCTVCNDTVEEKISKTLHNTTQVHNYKDVCSICGFEDYTVPCALALIDFIPKLKAPESLEIDAIYAGEYNRENYNASASGTYVAVIFQASAKNSYNATTRDVYVYIYEVNGENVIEDLEATGELWADYYYGTKALEGYDMQTEAASLIAKATSNFTKQNDELILYLALKKLTEE